MNKFSTTLASTIALAIATAAVAQSEAPAADAPPPAAVPTEPAATTAAAPPVGAAPPVETAPPVAAATPAAPPTTVADSLGNHIASPPAGMGQVIFFRRGTIVGAAISCATFENGAKVSSLSPGRYFVLPATPGVHNYTVRSEAKDVLRLEIEAGETYFAECTIGMGFMAGRPNLSPSDVAAFNGRLPKLKPAEQKTATAQP
jgi:hypothetical protein